jgi:ABC-2 type transport system permease protein
MLTLLKKELSYYFNNPIGYIVAILFAIFANFLFIKDIFLRGDSSMRPFFDILPWLFLVFIPALTMRIFSEEKRTNTIEVLLTLPITETNVAIAKLIALLTFSVFAMLLTLLIPATLKLVGKPYLPEIGVAYVGAFLLSASFISVSMFFSSLTKNQIVAFLCSVITIFLLIVLGGDFLASFIPRFILESISSFSPLYHYDNFLKGLVDLRSVVYFFSLMILFIFLTVINLEKRE